MNFILLLAFCLRLIFLYIFRDINNYDLSSYIKIGSLVLKGVNIYPNPANLNHPYLPFYLWLEALAVFFGQMRLIGLMRLIGPISPILFLKMINVIFDMGILYLVYLLSNKNKRSALIYALNPVTILIFVLHGQFDALPIFFIMLAIYFNKKKNEVSSLLSFSFSILTKTWPMLFLFAFYKRIKNKKNILLVAVFPILSLLVYCLIFKTNPIEIIKTVFGYQGLFGIWGWAKIFTFIKLRLRFQKLFTFLFLTIFYLYSYKNSKKTIINEIYVLILFFYVFTTGFSIQYLCWVIPFLILVRPKYWFWLLILMTAELLSYYYPLIVGPSSTMVAKYAAILQNILDIFLWLSFIKMLYISKKTT